VAEVSADHVSMRLDGAAVMADDADLTKAETVLDARLVGHLEYDRRAQAFTRFDVAAVAPYRGLRGDCQGQTKGTKIQTTLGFAFELAPAAAWVKAVPPRGTRLATGSSKSLEEYFRGAPGKIRDEEPK
jgi:hypothetical protein